MALWAAQDCEDWDLYLTVVVDTESAQEVIAVTHEVSERHGCYETMLGD